MGSSRITGLLVNFVLLSCFVNQPFALGHFPVDLDNINLDIFTVILNLNKASFIAGGETIP